MNEISSLNSNNEKIKKMLNNLYEIFLIKFKYTQKAWDRLLEFIAVDNSAKLFFEIGKNLEWLFIDKRFRNSVFSVYDSNLLRSVYYDYLGEMYFEIFKKKKINQVSPTKIQTQSNGNKSSIKILDLNVDTGKTMMDIYRIYPQAIYFGVTKDINLLRIALTNSFLFGIKCYLLYSNNEVQELKLTTEKGKNIWKQANCWSFNTIRQNFGEIFS